MAALPTQKVVIPSLLPAFVAAGAGGDTCKPGDHTFLVVKNGAAAPINVTITSFPDTTGYGGAIPDMVVAVANGTERWIGPLHGSQFANSAGDVGISYSSATTITVGVITT